MFISIAQRLFMLHFTIRPPKINLETLSSSIWTVSWPVNTKNSFVMLCIIILRHLPCINKKNYSCKYLKYPQSANFQIEIKSGNTSLLKRKTILWKWVLQKKKRSCIINPLFQTSSDRMYLWFMIIVTKKLLFSCYTTYQNQRIKIQWQQLYYKDKHSI